MDNMQMRMPTMYNEGVEQHFTEMVESERVFLKHPLTGQIIKVIAYDNFGKFAFLDMVPPVPVSIIGIDDPMIIIFEKEELNERRNS